MVDLQDNMPVHEFMVQGLSGVEGFGELGVKDTWSLPAQDAAAASLPRMHAVEATLWRTRSPMWSAAPLDYDATHPPSAREAAAVQSFETGTGPLPAALCRPRDGAGDGGFLGELLRLREGLEASDQARQAQLDGYMASIRTFITDQTGEIGRLHRAQSAEIMSRLENAISANQASVSQLITSNQVATSEASNGANCQRASPTSSDKIVTPTSYGRGLDIDNGRGCDIDKDLVKDVSEQGDRQMANAKDAVVLQNEFTLPLLRFLDPTECNIMPHASHWSSTWSMVMSHLCGVASGNHSVHPAFFEPMTGCFARFVDGHMFKVLSAMVIMLNFGFIMVQTDWKIEHLKQEQPDSLKLIELFFTL